MPPEPEHTYAIDRSAVDLTYRAENGSLFDRAHRTMGHLIGKCMTAPFEDDAGREAVNALHTVHDPARQVLSRHVWFR